MSKENPMHYCFHCNKYIGLRGFCSKDCHDYYYDEFLEKELNSQKEHFMEKKQ